MFKQIYLWIFVIKSAYLNVSSQRKHLNVIITQNIRGLTNLHMRLFDKRRPKRHNNNNKNKSILLIKFQ